MTMLDFNRSIETYLVVKAFYLLVWKVTVKSIACYLYFLALRIKSASIWSPLVPSITGMVYRYPTSNKNLTVSPTFTINTINEADFSRQKNVL